MGKFLSPTIFKQLIKLTMKTLILALIILSVDLTFSSCIADKNVRFTEKRIKHKPVAHGGSCPANRHIILH